MTTFTIDIKKILDRVETKALYKARNIKKDGTSDFYQLSIVDARPFLIEKIRTVLARIWSTELSQYSIEDGYTYDDTDPLDIKVSYEVEFPENFRTESIPSISRAIEDAIVNFVIYQWMMASNYDYRKDEQEYRENMDEIRSLVARRTKLVRTYKLY